MSRTLSKGIRVLVQGIQKLTSDILISPPVLCFLTQSAHLAMIDTLMMAYTVETASVEKVTTCIRQYTCGSTEEESLYDTEEAMTTWINTVCLSVFSWNLQQCSSYNRPR